MPKPFPQFDAPESLPDGASWTAEFDSYDQRTESAYYCIRRLDAAGQKTELWARVHCNGVPDDKQLHADVKDVAERGESNTSHTDSMAWYMRRAGI